MKAAAWVSAAFPPVTRVTELSWTHHRSVAEMAPGDRAYLLSTARNEKWSTRVLIERVSAIKETRRGKAVAANGEPIETDESLAWVPMPVDLTDDARAVLDGKLAGIGKRHRIGYERAWIDCLVWTEQRDCFTEWKA
jgi:hypothetical protein